MDAIIISSDQFDKLVDQIELLNERVEKINKKDPLEDRWLDIQDVCELLHISKRTLQSYRDKGILPFSQIGAKIYYKASDIQKHLDKHYNPAF